VEKVSLKKAPGHTKHTESAATVALVNEEGTLVLWAFVQHAEEEVCQYFTSITNLGRGSLDDGISKVALSELLAQCFRTNTIIGFQVKNDLRSLGSDYEKVEELQDYFRDNENRSISVRALAAQFLKGKEIQQAHDRAIVDARVTLALFKIKQNLIQEPNVHLFSANITRPMKVPFKNHRRILLL